MRENERILLVKLFNRLSFVMHNIEYQNAIKDITDEMTIKDLQLLLDEIYLKSREINIPNVIKIHFERM